MHRVSSFHEGVRIPLRLVIWALNFRRMAAHGIKRRDSSAYKEQHYRAHWQPLWAYLGLLLCSLLMVSGGWAAVYDLVVGSPGVDRRDSVADLVAVYAGVSIRPL